jgi:hypothetical protein
VVTCDDIALVQRLCAKKPTPSSSNCRNSDLRQGLLGLGSHDDLAKIEPAKKGSLDQGGSVGHTKQIMTGNRRPHDNTLMRNRNVTHSNHDRATATPPLRLRPARRYYGETGHT